MDTNLILEIVPAHQLKPDFQAEIYALCNRAYQRDLKSLFNTLHNPTHVLAWLGTRLVSHAMWVTRWLQAGDQPLLHTAYVEMVATEPEFQRHGFATHVMQRLARAITEFEVVVFVQPSPSYMRNLVGFIGGDRCLSEQRKDCCLHLRKR